MKGVDMDGVMPGNEPLSWPRKPRIVKGVIAFLEDA